MSEEVDWTEILKGGLDHDGPWVSLTPERVAVLSLLDCADQLQRARNKINRLSLAAKAAHHALQAALTAAVAGTASIGAFPDKLAGEYLDYFERSRSEPASRPTSDRVMSFEGLLQAATERPLPWTGQPLEVGDEDRALLERLAVVRHAFEHPKPGVHSIEPRYIAEALPVAATLAVESLKTVFHHLEEAELKELEDTVNLIRALASGFCGEEMPRD